VSDPIIEVDEDADEVIRSAIARGLEAALPGDVAP
jgi:hypothetical protein